MAKRQSTSEPHTTARQSATPRRRAPAAAVTARPPGSVIMQARVDAAFAEELLHTDAPVLGIDGASELVREGLRLVHRRAQEQALIDSYDTYYDGERAPLPV